MSLRKSALRGIFWTFSQQFGAQGIQFCVSIVMARLLLPEEFGLIGMITVFIAIGKSLMETGLTQSLIRTENPDQEDYSTVFYFNLVGSIIVYFLLFFTAPYIANFYNQFILIDIIRVYCLSFVIGAFSAVQIARLSKIMDFRTQMLVTIPSLIGAGLLGIILAYNGYGVWSLVWMGLSQVFFSTVQLWWKSRWKPSLEFNIAKFKFHFKFGYKLTLSSLLDILFKNIFQIIIGKFFMTSQVGFYSRANSLKQLPVSSISGAMNKVTYPLFASIQNDDARLRKIYKQMMQIVVFVIAPLLITMGVLAEPLFRFLFTEKWVPAVPYFKILCLAGIAYPLSSYNLNILKIKGRSDLFLKLEIIKKTLIIVTIGISIQFGIMGLIWGQLFTSIISLAINSQYSGKLIAYNSWQQAKDMAPIIIIAIISGVAVYAVDHWMLINYCSDFLRLLTGGSLGLTVFVGISLILKLDVLQNLKIIVLKR